MKFNFNFKINYFKKIFLYSIFIILITVLINYLLNIAFFDSFYQFKKKKLILKVSNEIREMVVNPEQLEFFREDIRDLYGVEFRIKNQNKNNTSKTNDFFNRRILHGKIDLKKNNFSINKIPGIDAKLLIYTDKISDREWLIIWTSVTVMESHKKEMFFFNFLASIFAISFSIFLAQTFSKRLTKDLSKLRETAKKISTLEFPKDIIIHREDEIGDLSRDLEIMSKQLLDDMNNLKSFVSNASHELKTPIAILSAHAQALVNENISQEKAKKYHEVILRETLDMEQLLSKLLVISKLNSSAYKLNLKNIDLNLMIENSCEKYEFLELKNDISINKKLIKTLIVGDYSLIKIVLDNIVQNALKYSKEGGILNIYEKENKIYFSNETEKTLNKNLNHLWEPFSRGVNATESNLDGYGLGLSLVKKILELHKFNFGIETEENIFIFWIEIFKKGV
ncbi:MAG: sensor histidine kinase [Fusobacteriaceae bacterium]